MPLLLFNSTGSFKIHNLKLMPTQKISLTNFVCCVHIWFASACCNVPFDGLSLIQYYCPAAASSPCQSSTMWRDEGVYTHSSKLCALETHVTLIGLFTIVIKFSHSETNVWNSGHVDCGPVSPKVCSIRQQECEKGTILSL